MQIAYKTLLPGWNDLESLIGDGFKIDNGIAYHIEVRGANALLCEQIDIPTTMGCGESITSKDILPVGNRFYISAEGQATINVSCANNQYNLPTAHPVYCGKIIEVNDKYYKCSPSQEDPYMDYELTNGDDIEKLTIENAVFDNVGLPTGEYHFIADIEEGYFKAQTVDGETIELHRANEYDTDVEYYYTYIYEGTVMRAFMLYDPPVEGEHVFNPDTGDEFAYVTEIVEDRPIWSLNGIDINLGDYGIEFTGDISVGDGIIIYYTRPDIAYQWSEIT